MHTLTTVQTIELFHVAFLDALSTRVDPSRYVLKGGANLRYFFDSLRYSEDIDLDLRGVPGWRLEEKVTGLLEGGTVDLLMRAHDLKVAHVSANKQTETTRRWKVGLESPARSDLVATKIEFSDRNGDSRCETEQIPRRITNPYGLRAPRVQHYNRLAATEQKVLALAGRPQTQARDVFDLDLLLRKEALEAGAITKDRLDEAISAAMELSFDSFRDQVVAFLEPEAAELYDSPGEWDRMQTEVGEKLEAAK